MSASISQIGRKISASRERPFSCGVLFFCFNILEPNLDALRAINTTPSCYKMTCGRKSKRGGGRQGRRVAVPAESALLGSAEWGRRVGGGQHGHQNSLFILRARELSTTETRIPPHPGAALVLGTGMPVPWIAGLHGHASSLSSNPPEAVGHPREAALTTRRPVSVSGAWSSALGFCLLKPY